MNYYDDSHVERVLMKDIGGYFSYLINRLYNIMHQRDDAWSEQFPKVVYHDPLNFNGDIRSMTCFTDKVKVTKVIGTNPTKNPVSVGTVIHMSQLENRPIGLYDATALSSIRTAATAALGMGINNPNTTPGRVLIIGRGMVGTYLERFIRNLWPSMALGTWDIKDGARHSFNGYDVVFTATTSEAPFLFTANCDAELVVSAGADTHFNRELSSNFISGRRNIYVDAEDAKKIGDLEAISGVSVKGNLWFMMEKKDADLFISTGTALMDALTVEYLYEHA